MARAFWLPVARAAPLPPFLHSAATPMHSAQPGHGPAPSPHSIHPLPPPNSPPSPLPHAGPTAGHRRHHQRHGALPAPVCLPGVPAGKVAPLCRPRVHRWVGGWQRLAQNWRSARAGKTLPRGACWRTGGLGPGGKATGLVHSSPKASCWRQQRVTSTLRVLQLSGCSSMRGQQTNKHNIESSTQKTESSGDRNNCWYIC